MALADDDADEELAGLGTSPDQNHVARLRAFARYQRARAAKSEAYAADILDRLEQAAADLMAEQTTELACVPESQRGALRALQRGSLSSLALFAQLAAAELAAVRHRADQALRASLSVAERLEDRR